MRHEDFVCECRKGWRYRFWEIVLWPRTMTEDAVCALRVWWRRWRVARDQQWDDPLPRLPMRTQLVRLRFKDAGSGQPRGNFELEV